MFICYENNLCNAMKVKSAIKKIKKFFSYIYFRLCVLILMCIVLGILFYINDNSELFVISFIGGGYL